MVDDSPSASVMTVLRVGNVATWQEQPCKVNNHLSILIFGQHTRDDE
jgi:hypothetical protein